jgi:hydrogenase maturation protein HypF
VAERLRLDVRGAAEGVSFRPFVSRLARERQLRGWVQHSSHGVVIEMEGERAQLDGFRLAFEREHLPHAAIQSIDGTWLDAAGLTDVAINDGEPADHPSAIVMPDIALCESCRGELLDPNNRRYHYPFIACTNCGPRYTIIEQLPYDRANTSMRDFVMCHACQREYHDPLDRRFHAAPNACPVCGPHVALWDATGTVVATRDGAVMAAANAITAGQIVAVKGLGGFQLLVDATDDAAVRRLRAHTHCDQELLAIMCPDLECVQQHAVLGPDEAGLLVSPEAPIVLVATRTDTRQDAPSPLAPSVAPGSRQLGVMLPYTPLLVLLMRDLRRPIVATSGTHIEASTCIDEREVVARLGGIADLFLVHNRRIARQVDDSTVRVVRGRLRVLRRARGYAPWPIERGDDGPPVVRVSAT